MRLMAAALTLSLTLAVVAAVFAIWPVIADAPWEDRAPEPVVKDETDIIRCQAALDLRQVVIENKDNRFTEVWDDYMTNIKGEIEAYC